MTETATPTPTSALVVEEQETRPGFIGTSVPRKEDRRLVQGEGVFFDDVKRHGMGFVHFVRSPYAHAKIKSIDVARALEPKDVYGTLTGDEVAILTDPFFEMSVPPGNEIKDYALAVGKTRFVGEPVAAVVAATRELARDAAELVEVEYEPLDPLVDARRAQDSDAPILHDDAGSNVVWEGVFDWGDWEGTVAEADRIVRIKELHFDRFSSTPVECLPRELRTRLPATSARAPRTSGGTRYRCGRCASSCCFSSCCCSPAAAARRSRAPASEAPSSCS